MTRDSTQIRKLRKEFLPLEHEVLGLFSGLAKILGFPRSVGEIYGFLYLEGVPMSMGDITRDLGISVGSVSQGLRILRKLEGVTVSQNGLDRRDHYQAEDDFRRMLWEFINGYVNTEVGLVKESIDSILEKAETESRIGNTLGVRIEGIREIYDLMSQIVPTARLSLGGER